MEKRPPVVVVMGHVDHGKTKILDYIRKTTLASKEAGGITQAIGAYEISHNDQSITFIDTPGHEAFSKMRERGARVADLAILVIAADDSVKPQTKDALAHILEAKIPYVIAINKIDVPGANVEKVKNDLMQAGVFLEGSGGTISYQPISAKTGEGVNDLLDLVLLSSDVQGLTYDPEAEASGIIITSERSPKKGLLVGVILKNGTLKVRDTIATPSAGGKIKMLSDFLGRSVSTLLPSAPALASGFETLPLIGEEFVAGGSVVIPNIVPVQKQQTEKKKNDTRIRVILKADEGGSLEALQDFVLKFQIPNGSFAILDAQVGNVHEGDVKLAVTTKALIIGFRTTVDRAAENLIQAHRVNFISSSIIYELGKELEEFILREVKGIAPCCEVLVLFGRVEGRERVLGVRVLSGSVKVGDSFRLLRGEDKITEGKITNIKSGKDRVAEATLGTERGVLVEMTEDVPVQVGDILQF